MLADAGILWNVNHDTLAAMNPLPISEQLLTRLRTISHTLSVTEGGSHGPDHSERVLTTAVSIGQQMHARLDIV